MRRLGLLILVVVTLVVAPRAQQPADQRTLILISFDGFRWDYRTKAPTPNLQRLIERGVHAENLIPSFPSKTFPNHYTIVTGLYPAHHGIVANTVKDPPTGRLFLRADVKELRDPMWWGGEPIWVTVQKQGGVSATLFWPGSEAPIGGVSPRYWKPYDEDYPANDRIDDALRWLDLPAGQRPNLITLYFEDTDTAGHASGPDSTEVREAIMRADSYVGRLVRGLDERKLTDRTNVVVVSDHGMSGVSLDRTLVLDDYVSGDDVGVIDINPTLGIFPKNGKDKEVLEVLKKANPHLHVYKRTGTPRAWHYRDHPRIPTIVGVVDDGWQILRRAAVTDIRNGRTPLPGGQHGYDPQYMSMRGIFVAAGPAFRQGVTVDAFQNIQIYNVLAKALGVKPAKNDGGEKIARRVLR